MPAATIPRKLPREIERPHLHDQVENTLAKWVALIAPAGYGKTTFLGQMATRKSTPVVWISADDPFLDLHALINTLEIRLPGSGPALAERLSGVTLVIDPTNHFRPEVFAYLAHLVREAPADFRLFTAGPALPEQDLQNLLQAGQLLVVRAEDLVFSLQESVELLAHRPQLQDPAGIHKMLEGCPMRVSLVSYGATPSKDTSAMLTEVLENLPGDLAAFLPGLSVVQVWEEGTLAQLIPELAAGWTVRLLQAGFPLTQEIHGPIRPHPVLQQTLNGILKTDPALHQSLHDRAALLALARGNLFQAFRHQVQGGNLTAAAELADRLVPALQVSGRWSLIEELLRQLPEQILSPALRLALARCLSVREVTPEAHRLYLQLFERNQLEFEDLLLLAGHHLQNEEATHALTFATHALERASTPEERCPALRVKALSAALLGQGTPFIPQLNHEMESARRDQRPEDVLGLLYALGQLQTQDGMWKEALGSLEEATRLSRDLNLPRATFTVGGAWVRALSATGRSMQALKLLDELQRLTEQAFPGRLGWIHALRAVVHCDRHDVSEARKSISTGLLLCKEDLPEHLRTRRMLIHLQGFTHHQLGEAQALQTLVQETQPVNEDPPDQEHLLLRALLSWNQQDAEGLDLWNVLLQGRLRSLPMVQLYWAAARTRQGEALASDLDPLMQTLEHMETDALLRDEASHLQEVYGIWVSRRWHAERFLPHLQQSPTMQGTHTLHLQTFGGFAARVQGQPIRIPLKKAQEVLLWLAWHGASTLPELMEGMWGEPWGQKERKYLHVALAELRKAFAQVVPDINPISFDGLCYQIHEKLQVRLDVREFLFLQHSTDLQQVQEILLRFSGRWMPALDRPWTDGVREQLHFAAMDLGLKLGEVHQTSNPLLALAAYKKVLEQDPLHEEAHQKCVMLLRQTGQHHAALEAQQQYEYLLRLD
ncbi:hypothetical protein [Deinococcus cellulosilyticus]|uniref:Uncharacterized protein n=1 Tax=Deinococcus cellulosilyticus (strain DSM 18568 / NBRC 106333 / KACC 11606 / 5516J-15) TaxID=1223518 RepID=A0A511N091_DEIC1|nr:hypothetical protein [Deinococcus cellulosilyticus]GEM46239.1 hypothetical protein DC3_18740 [Deinococcus cellulosilyticus NBRC 106333 = KACC 11606]